MIGPVRPLARRRLPITIGDSQVRWIHRARVSLFVTRWADPMEDAGRFGF